MSSKERGVPTPEQPKPTPITELISHYEADAKERARRILDPLDKHPFLATFAGSHLPEVDEVVKQTGYFSPQSANVHFNEALLLRTNHPHRYDDEIGSLVDRGFELITEISERQDHTDRKLIPLRTTGVYSPVAAYISHIETKDRLKNDGEEKDLPPVAVAMDLLNTVIDDELFSSDETDPIYNPEDMKALLAAAVGLAQAVVTDKVERTQYFTKGTLEETKITAKQKKNRNRGVRDQILMYAFLRIMNQGQLPPQFEGVAEQSKDITDYFFVQKELEQLFEKSEGEKDKKKKKEDAPQIHLYGD